MATQDQKPAPSRPTSYDPGIALEFFKSAGHAETVAQGATLFAEKEKAIPLLKPARMFLLLKGDIELQAHGKPIAHVRPGEIFGELAVLAGAPRSAAAVAKTECSVIALDEKKFHLAIEHRPEFALMLMSIMIHRLRETIAQLQASGGLAKEHAWKEAAAFDKKALVALTTGLADDPPVHYNARQPIIAKGQKGLRMYAVLEGQVSVSIDGHTVEVLGPGGVFGEAAIISEAPRLASAVAETDCELLAISREAFLTLVKVSPTFADTVLTTLADRLRFLTAKLD
jgi:CRP-like cAMP-binding protein